jgi:hypothetical protein
LSGDSTRARIVSLGYNGGMRRTSIGILAVLLLVIGFTTALRGPTNGSAAGFAGGCVRMGLVLGALWLALPQIQGMVGRLPRWIGGWFGFKSKPPAGDRGDLAPAARPRRPRRRSTS